MKNLFIIFIFLAPIAILGQNIEAQLIEPALIKEDIDTLISRLKNSHPTFSEYYQQNKIQSKIDSIKESINKPMSSLNLFRIMQPMISIDGHTTLMYTGEIYPKMDNPFFPFKVIFYDNLVYVKENISSNNSITKGSTVESINGIPLNNIINNLIKYLPGEKVSYKKKSLEKDFRIYYSLVYGAFSEFNVIVDGTEYKVGGVNWGDFKEPSKPDFELRFYDNNIAYIYKRKFKPPKDFLHFMDSAFSVINKKQIEYLIIDNLQGGGLTDLADSMMLYFAVNPYCMFVKKMTKVSSLAKDIIDNEKPDGYFNDGYFI